MMTTASVQDIDSFIRLQKEKLSKDRYAGPSYPQPVITSDYNRQLDNYMNLPRNPIAPPDVQFRGVEPQYYPQNQRGSPINEPPPPPQQQAPPQSIRFNRQNGQNERQNSNFFNKFGSQYDAKKQKLKNDLQQEYSDYMQQKNRNENSNKFKKNQPPVSDEFYATLPLKGMDKERPARSQQYPQQQQQFSFNETRNAPVLRFKDSKDPEIKPYSRHASQENLPNAVNGPLTQDSRSLSQYFDPNGFEQTLNDYRVHSAGSLENLRPQYPVEAWRTPIPPPVQDIDPSLSEILRRPPVGLKNPIQPPARVQFSNNVRYNEYPTSAPNQYQSMPQQQQQYARGQQNDTARNANTHINNPLTVGSYGSLNNLTKAGQDAPFNFSEDQNKDVKAIKAKEYQEELQRQVREKQMQKQREKDEQERLDKKMLAEIASYNPYGRAGGGAPIKDKEGNTVADLSQVKADPSQYSPRDLPSQQQKPSFNFNPNLGFNPSSPNTFAPFNNSNFLTPSQQAQQQQNFLNSSRGNPPPGEDQKFARGGNGIFGEAKSDDQKKQEEKYKMELQRQIEDKKRQKELEKEKERLEDEKEYKRIMEQQERIKAELEEELRKKKEKEQVGQRLNDDAKRLADERKKQDNKPAPPPAKRNVTKPIRKINKTNSSDDFNQNQPGSSSPQPPQVEFRTNSPPVPAAAKKLNGGGKAPAGNVAHSPLPPPPKPNNTPKKKANATADYYVTESRLNLASPTVKEKTDINIVDRPASALITDYNNAEYKANNSKPSKLNNTGTIPTKPMIKKPNTRPPSQSSNSEVLSQLQNLKKHLHNEQMQVENELNNANNRTTVGQLTDLHHNILNVRTPPGDYGGGRSRRDPDFQKTYRKDLDTPPLNGGLEPRTYFRDHTVLLGDQKLYDDDLFSNDLQRQAHERQLQRLNNLTLNNDPLNVPYDIDNLTARNQQRLRKLRDLEDDNLSLADPNDVLNKFLTRNNR